MDEFAHLDHYQLLQIDRNASADEIKRAYRREISKYHPDRFATAPADQQAYAQLRSQRLTEAYTTLSDFASRTAYNRGETAPRRVVRPTRPATPEPAEPQPRDYQAELYTQAQEHMDAGRLLQAAAVLRQLQQINPFYPNSAALLSRIENQLAAQQQPVSNPPQRNGPPRAALIGAGVTGAVLVGAAVWAISQQGASASQPTATAVPVAVAATSSAATVPPAPTAAPVGLTTAAPVPTSVPTTRPDPSNTPEPTATLAPSNTPEPTATATSVPVLAEDGAVVLEDGFSGDGWASLSGAGWSVGYINSGYQIAVDAGVGAIWSYRSGAPANASIGTDMFNVSGAGGLLVRFVDNDTYISYTVASASQSYQLVQQVGGQSALLATGTNAAILPGETNRIVARLTGSTIRLYVNDTLLETVDVSSAPASSRYGLVGVSGAGPADIRFDNLSIRTASD